MYVDQTINKTISIERKMIDMCTIVIMPPFKAKKLVM